MSKKKSWILFYLLLSLPACGYRAISSIQVSNLPISQIESNLGGRFTSELIYQLNQLSLYDPTASGALLRITIADPGDEVVGFRYDRQAVSGDLEKNLMATESRKKLIATLILLDAATHQIWSDPITVSIEVEYDYIDVSSLKELSYTPPGSATEPVIHFSLGQLDSVEGAHDAALLLAYRTLAQKVVLSIQKRLVDQ